MAGFLKALKTGFPFKAVWFKFGSTNSKIGKEEFEIKQGEWKRSLLSKISAGRQFLKPNGQIDLSQKVLHGWPHLNIKILHIFPLTVIFCIYLGFCKD